MSSINDPEQLTGSSRIYANAKPGIIMDAFAMAGESSLVSNSACVIESLVASLSGISSENGTRAVTFDAKMVRKLLI